MNEGSGGVTWEGGTQAKLEPEKGVGGGKRQGENTPGGAQSLELNHTKSQTGVFLPSSPREKERKLGVLSFKRGLNQLSKVVRGGLL